MNVFQVFWNETVGYWNYLINDISNPSTHSYFYGLWAVSLLVWGLEILSPWRKKQSIIRKDFYLDAFYMFFNFFIFSLIGYEGISTVIDNGFTEFWLQFGIKWKNILYLGAWPYWTQLLFFFILRDFIQWWTHRLLHRTPWLWRYHKVHHSVKEMGFAAHLRFHWMETIVYRTIEYIPLGLIGFSVKDFFIIHMFAVIIGHLNHSNLNLDYGPLRYILNNPRMHLWHHVKAIPKGHKYGINYGLSLSIWDYIFGTAHVPKRFDPYIELGFPKDEEFPNDFLHQQKL